MWDLPGPGIEPMSPALAGGFLINAPLGKSSYINLEFLPRSVYFPSLIYSIIWTQIFIYTVGYNPILLYLFCCKMCFIFQHWPFGALSVGSCFPLTYAEFILNWYLCLLFPSTLDLLQSREALCVLKIILPGTLQTCNKHVLNKGMNRGMKDILVPWCEQ